MKTKFIYIALATLGVFSFPSVHAQERESTELERTMVLEREYNPIVRDASKINTLPQVDDPIATKTQAEYSPWTTTKESDEKAIKTLDSGKSGLSYPFTKQLGWVNFAGGNNTNLQGSAGLSVNTQQGRFSLTLDHHSTNGKRNLIQSPQETRTAKWMDNLAKLGYIHAFDKVNLSLGAEYIYNTFNYYGVDNPLIYKDESYVQAHNNLKFHAAIASKEVKNQLNYKVGIGVSSFSQKSVYGPSTTNEVSIPETYIKVNGEISLPFQEVNQVALGVDLNSFSYGTSSVTEINTADYGFTGYSLLGLNPSYRLNMDNLKLQLGARLDMSFGKGKSIMPAPDVKIDYAFSPGYTLFAHIGGGNELYNYEAAYKENRYIAPLLRLDDVYAPIDGTIGFKGDTGVGFYFELFGGYKWYDNSNFYVQENGYIYTKDLKASNLKFGAIAKYKYQNIVDLGLKVQKNNWSVNYKEEETGEMDEAKAWNRPGLELSADVDAHITSNLTLSLNYYLGSDRWGAHYVYPDAIYGKVLKTVKMDNISELSLSARYNFLQRFTISAKVNNILNSKYDIYYGMPSQGINFLFGAGLRF